MYKVNKPLAILGAVFAALLIYPTLIHTLIFGGWKISGDYAGWIFADLAFTLITAVAALMAIIELFVGRARVGLVLLLIAAGVSLLVRLEVIVFALSAGSIGQFSPLGLIGVIVPGTDFIPGFDQWTGQRAFWSTIVHAVAALAFYGSIVVGVVGLRILGRASATKTTSNSAD